jgi:hypothetical protein
MVYAQIIKNLNNYLIDHPAARNGISFKMTSGNVILSFKALHGTCIS